MSGEDRELRRGSTPVDADALDEPLVRYSGADALLTIGGDDPVDLNSLEDPFTGEIPVAAEPTGDRRRAEADSESRERVGRRLRALREDNKFSKAALAKGAGVSAAELTRAESGDPRMGLALVDKLVRTMGARLSEIATPDAPELSVKALVRIGTTAGAPRELLKQLALEVGRRDFTTALDRAFGWRPDELLAEEPQSPAAEAPVAFKTVRTEVSQSSPILALARRMSELAAGLYDQPYAGVPEDPAELRQLVLQSSGEDDVTLQGLLDWTWDTGVVVLPLARAPEFYAAAWFVGQRPVVVLKDSRAFAAYWLFDLAHELGHLALGHVAERGIVDVGDPKNPDLADAQEAEANAYALALLLPDTEELLADVRRRTGTGLIARERFKWKVMDVAAENGLSAAVLGLAAARVMGDVSDLRDLDRWGSAQNIAKEEDPEGRARVAATFATRIDLDALEELDEAVLRTVALQS